jgi:hypothetical protein
MARKMVVVSDLSGKMATDEDTVTVRVLEHPELGGQPVELDVLASEVDSITEQAMDFALVEVRRPGQQPIRYALDAADFDKTADRPMAQVLQEAAVVREAPEPRRRGRPRKSAEGASTTRAKAPRDYDLAALRAWAASNKVDTPPRGRIPQKIVDQFKQAMG